jgi:hypothetical protein
LAWRFSVPLSPVMFAASIAAARLLWMMANREDAIMRRCPRFIVIFLGFWVSAQTLLRIILIADLSGFPTV